MDLNRRARSWRAQGRRAIVIGALAESAGGVAALLGALALADRFLPLPGGVREAGLLAAAAWLASVLARRAWRPWRALTWDAVFDQAAAAWPETRAILASAWALAGTEASPGTSEELRAEHGARADRLAASLPDRSLYSQALSPRARRWAAAGLAALAANAAWGDRASWARALTPWSDAALERWISVAPGDARPDWGGPVAVTAAPNVEGAKAGVRAGELALEARGSDGAWRSLPWTVVSPGSDEWRTADISAALDYRVRWRDRVSRAYRLDPAPPPRWKRATAVVRETRGERRYALGEDAPVRARRGDWVEIEAEGDGPLASASLRLAGREPSAMRRDGERWRGGFLAAEDGSLSFELVSGDGRRDPSPPAYAVKVAADAPPTAELLSPQVPLVASPGDSVVIAYAARDDGAVTRAEVVFSIPGQAPHAVPLTVASPPPAELLGDHTWTVPRLRPGTRVEFRIEAFDDASPPQKGTSESGSVEIVDAAADHAAALAARDAADAAVERAAARAESASEASARNDLAVSAERTRELRSDWPAAKSALDEWAKRSGADPRGDPGLAEEAARAAQEFARAGEEGLPDAAAALAAADAARAGRAQDALAQQARGVQRALREGARAQEVQDFAQKMSDAGKTGDELARKAGELAGRGSQGTVSPAEMEALEKSLDDVEKALDELRRALKDLPEVTPEQATGRTEDMPLDAARQAAGDLRRALRSGDVAGAAKAARALAERLKRLAQTLDGAGRRAAEDRGRRGSEAAERVRRAWQDAVDAQTRAVESARKVDDGRLQALLEEQRAFVRRLGADFDREVSSASATGAARLARAEGALAEASLRFKAGDAPGASALTREASARLRASGAPGADPFAAALDGLVARLQKGPAAVSAGAEASRGAADAQSGALARARALRGEVESASKNMGYLSGRVGRRVDDAIGEESGGEGALRRGDSVEGLRRAEAALSLLQEGGREADAASSAAGGAASSMGAGAGSAGGEAIRAAPRGASGVRYERVRLPSAEDYKPPRELREELRRSLSEPRPAAQDGVIKEYFKRLAR
ncbi:MAG: hypothetical protein KGJ84_10525 [Elusimicrobia bacterium]|nr:hypothetical protein [Elusimicrobiota bacterium]